jgi:hypothetical protein
MHGRPRAGQVEGEDLEEEVRAQPPAQVVRVRDAEQPSALSRTQPWLTVEAIETVSASNAVITAAASIGSATTSTRPAFPAREPSRLSAWSSRVLATSRHTYPRPK